MERKRGAQVARPPETTTLMSSTKTPTPLLSGSSTIEDSEPRVLNSCAALTTVIKLLAKRVWGQTGGRRVTVNTKKTRSDGRVEAQRDGGSWCCGKPINRITQTRPHAWGGSSPAARLPLEIVEIIVAHLIYGMPGLLTCSLTCYYWYLVTIPHLHHTVRADLGGHLKYSQRWSGVCAGVLLGAQGAVRRGESRGEL